MPYASTSASMACAGGPLAAIETELLIVPWFPDEPSQTITGLDAATGGEIGRAIASKEFQAKAFELFVTPVIDRGWRARRVALVGSGPGERGSELVRKMATAA